MRDSKENIRRLGLITFMSYSCMDKKTSLHQIQLNLYVDKFSSNRGKTFFGGTGRMLWCTALGTNLYL